MTAALADARRGRPSVAGLSDQLDRSRSRNTTLRMELRSAAGDMRDAARRLEYAVAADRPDLILHTAARLTAQADGFDRS